MSENLNVSPESGDQDVCRPLEVDGETVRVRGAGELTEEGQEAVADLVRAAKAKFVAEAPEQVGVLQKRLRLAHAARRAKEHQLDGVRRALCDADFMQDDDPYGHADLEDVIRQVGEVERGEIAALRAEVAAARKFAAEMRDFCSPHAVAADYADRLLDAMDRAQEGGTPAGSGLQEVLIRVHAPTDENAAQWAQTIRDLVVAEHGQDMRLTVTITPEEAR
jgi:hypothetical protein